jgi:hypothetical protein
MVKRSRDAEHRLIIRTLTRVMLGRRPSVTDPLDDVGPDGVYDDPNEPAGKGRPTPKRSDARKARRNVTPKNRKEAAALQRDKRREERQVARKALLTGDERNLPPRDAGPEKRLARDVVDSRFTYGQVFFGLIIFVFLLSIIPSTQIKDIANYVALFSLTLMVIDGAMNGRRAKAAVAEKFGAGAIRGISTYAFMRALLPRRFRRPPPRMKHGKPV